MQWKFKPKLIASIAVLIAVPIMLSLGMWQLDRADEKRSMQQEFHEAQSLPPLEIDIVLQDADRYVYRQILVKGVVDKEHQFLLDNQIVNGRPGYHVITPVILNNGLRLLLNRGWVPLGGSRDVLPEISTVEDWIEVIGRLYPYPGIGMKLDYDDGSEWPMVVQYLDEKVSEHALNADVFPYIVRLNKDQPYGYVRDWQLISANPEKHTAYAVQWFLFVAIAIGLYVGLNLKRVND